MIVVADTSPLNYLILLGHVDVLEVIYSDVIIPPAVQDEMLDPLAPPAVRAWITSPPYWLEVRTPGHVGDSLTPNLDDGEREAIALVQSGGVGSVLLIDERAGRMEATRLGIKVTGTLAVLEEADKRGLLDLKDAIERLSETTFKASQSLLQDFLNRAQKIE